MEETEIDQELVEELKQSKTKFGALAPIILDKQGNIVEGHHRAAADPAWPKVTYEEIETEEDRILYAIAFNWHRREKSSSWKTKMLSQLATKGYNAKEISEKTGLSEQTIYRYLPDEYKDQTKIEAGKLGGEAFALSLRAEKEAERTVPCASCGTQLRSGEPIAIKDKVYCKTCADKISPEPQGKGQRVRCARCGNPTFKPVEVDGQPYCGSCSGIVKSKPRESVPKPLTREPGTEPKEGQEAGFEPATPSKNLPMPMGNFEIIYADPPWRYDVNHLRGSPEEHYPTMTTDKICSLKVPVSENAVLFLWATNPMLEDALQVMKSWGFQYKTNMVWTKNKMGVGFWFRGQHELLLVGTKGNVSAPEQANRFSSVLMAPVREHSQKPDEVYQIIEKMFPNVKLRLELFARNQREGWQSWGNEI